MDCSHDEIMTKTMYTKGNETNQYRNDYVILTSNGYSVIIWAVSCLSTGGRRVKIFLQELLNEDSKDHPKQKSL